jgi:hypothetical protein
MASFSCLLSLNLSLRLWRRSDLNGADESEVGPPRNPCPAASTPTRSRAHATTPTRTSVTSGSTSERAQSKRQKAVAQAVRDAAAVLGNTPAIARGSYIDPRVIDHYTHNRTIDPTRLGSAESELRALLFD